jgi:tRNA 2-thiouridine synthesizing protein A
MGTREVKTMEQIKADETLDCRGQSCPMPVLKTRKALDKIESGQILEILGTDPGTGNDLPSFAKRGGHQYLGQKEDQGFIKYYIRKA